MSKPTTTKRDQQLRGPTTGGSRLLEMLLLVTMIALVLQIFPGVFRGALYVIDVRNWGWRSYTTVSAAAVIILAIFGAWQQR